MSLLRTWPLVLGLAAGLSSGQMTSTVRPAAGGPAPAHPAPVTVIPVPPAPAGPAGSAMPGTGAPSSEPVAPHRRGSAAESTGGDAGGEPLGAGAGSAVTPPAPGLPPTPQAIAASFLNADANRDGRLTRAEAQQLTVMPPGLTFEDLDRDKDGSLSRSEYEGGLGR